MAFSRLLKQTKQLALYISVELTNELNRIHHVI